MKVDTGTDTRYGSASPDNGLGRQEAKTDSDIKYGKASPDNGLGRQEAKIDTDTRYGNASPDNGLGRQDRTPSTLRGPKPPQGTHPSSSSDRISVLPPQPRTEIH